MQRFHYSKFIASGLLGLSVLLGLYNARTPQRVRQLQPGPLATFRARTDPANLCRQRIAAEQATAFARTETTLDRNRAELLARARGSSVLYLREPVPKGLDAKDEWLREQLTTSRTPWTAVEALLKETYKQPARLRGLLLREGYFYVDAPALGSILSNCITLKLLFSEPRLELTRGTVTRTLSRRKDGEYVFTDDSGTEAVATLLLFDRVTVQGEKLGPDFHVSITDVRESLGASRFSLTHQSASHLIGTFEYASYEVPTLLRIRGRTAELDCEAVPKERREELARLRGESRRRAVVLRRLREVVEAQVKETLPFDEPKTEEGQQDGKLRREWVTAYKNGAYQFKFNGDSYPVFDSSGRPRTPQVCIDFITDTWERLSGTYWNPRGAPRSRLIGRLDFDALPIENRRSVENLLTFASARPSWFDVLLIPEAERIALSNRRAFFERLRDRHKDYAIGDVVAILGPRDDDKLHYHSFFVIEDDPITGVATRVAANAGRPRIRTWEAEMQNAPRRAIVARIRPRLEWLTQLLE